MVSQKVDLNIATVLRARKVSYCTKQSKKALKFCSKIIPEYRSEPYLIVKIEFAEFNVWLSQNLKFDY